MVESLVAGYVVEGVPRQVGVGVGDGAIGQLAGYKVWRSEWQRRRMQEDIAITND